MASKKENIKALFSNTRSRVIIIFTLILLLITIIIGYIKLGSSTRDFATDASGVNKTPIGIKSIPGALNQTAQYAHLQEQQNIEQAQEASKSGGSAIPTIIRTQEFGAGVQSVGAVGGKGSVGFGTLAREDLGGAQNSLWIQSVQNSNCSKASLTNALNQGALLSDLKPACSCAQLKAIGYSISDLMPLCSCPDLKAAGFNIQQLKTAGFSAENLRICGFTACEERGAGFTAQEMKDGGFSDGELKGSGFSERDIARAGGLPDEVSIADVQKAGCDVNALTRMRAAGVSAAAIKRINGCSAAQLKAAGFSAQDLKNAGFSAAELKDAGFTAKQLKDGGYNARDLLNAGFSPKDLKNTGFAPSDIRQAEQELPPNMTPDMVKNAGCSEEAIRKQKLAGVSALAIRKYAGCNEQALKAAGFTQDDLINAGFSPKAISSTKPLNFDNIIKASGCDPESLKELQVQGVSAKRIHDLNGCDARTLKNAGFDTKDLMEAGFTPEQLATAGFTPAQIKTGSIADNAIKAAGCDPIKLKALIAQGVSAKRIHKLNNCDAQTLKNAGADIQSLAAAGFSPDQLLKSGFTPQELNAARLISDEAIRAAGCDPIRLKSIAAQGASARRIRDLNGCSASALKNTGFNPNQLATAGFTPSELAVDAIPNTTILAAGCDPTRLKGLLAQGVSAKRIHDLNGCDANALKNAGADLKALADAGYTPAELLTAGFTPTQMTQSGLALTPAGAIAAGRTANCSNAALKAAHDLKVPASTIKQTLGCSAAALKAAGYLPVDLKNAGFSAAELKNAGYSAAELKNAGYNAKEMRAAGFGAEQLKNLGFSAKALNGAGFSPSELKAAGFNAAQLKAAGIDAGALKAAGFSAKDLHDAGFSAEELKKAGIGANDLRKAGFSSQAIRAAGFSSEDSVLAGLDALERPSTPAMGGIPSIVPGGSSAKAANREAENAKKLQEIMKKQQAQIADQKFQQKIQQRTTAMLADAKQAIATWKTVANQQYQASSIKETVENTETAITGEKVVSTSTLVETNSMGAGRISGPVIKTGDIVFAVIDTSINSDEPGPILATVVSGALKGSKLIGSFVLPTNADKMVISFNTLSMPGAPKTISISAYAIDPNTARTALSSETDHHYLERYGALFASTFLEGFGNAFQSADTTITIGGTGGTTDTTTTVQNGIGRSALENAVIGLATVGKAWGQVAQQNMNRPTTVEVYSGTGIGVLFTQDLRTS